MYKSPSNDLAIKFTESGGSITILQKVHSSLPDPLCLWNRAKQFDQANEFRAYNTKIERMIEQMEDHRDQYRLVLETQTLHMEKEVVEAVAWLQMGVQDTGIGILVEDFHSLFLPYIFFIIHIFILT